MSNSLSPEQLDELCRLIYALHEKSITPQQMARLEEWVCRDDEACWVYI